MLKLSLTELDGPICWQPWQAWLRGVVHQPLWAIWLGFCSATEFDSLSITQGWSGHKAAWCFKAVGHLLCTFLAPAGSYIRLAGSDAEGWFVALLILLSPVFISWSYGFTPHFPTGPQPAGQPWPFLLSMTLPETRTWLSRLDLACLAGMLKKLCLS